MLDASADVPDALRDFAAGDFTVAVLQPNEPTTVVLQEEESGVTHVTAVFQFDGDELNQDEATLFVVGEPVLAGEDVCGAAFAFEKSGCIRALAWSLGTS